MRRQRLKDVNIPGASGQRLGVAAIVSGVEHRETKTGSKMTTFKMMDGAVKRTCTVFSPSNMVLEKLNNSAGHVMNIVFDVKPYKDGEDGISCILYDIDYTAVEDCWNFDEFVNSIENKEYYVQTLNTYLGYCSGTIYGEIARHLITKYWALYSTIPAASSMHHNLRGGLLQHSVSVAMLCLSDYNTYQAIYGEDLINYALLLSGALLHDIGKCIELESDAAGNASYSEAAVLRNHTMIGISEVIKAATALGFVEYPEINELVHLIASHHGKAEWGAMVEPRMVEAMILSSADERDALVNKFNRELGGDTTAQTKTIWGRGGMEAYAKSVGLGQAKANYSEFTGLVEETEQ